MAKLVYEKNFTLTTGMFDETSSIKPYGILDLFQRVAGDHADELRIGSNYCNQHNYGWILARQEVWIYAHPIPSDTVIIKTFPHEPGRIEFKREYEIKSQEGKILMRGCALWVLVDFNTHKMVKTDRIYPEGEFEENTYFPGKITRPASIHQEGKLIDSYQVTKSDIDIYHHMNNAKYAELVFNYSDYHADEIEHFAIQYQTEIKQNQIMDIYKLVVDNKTMITGIKDDKVIFTASITKKEGK